MPQNRSGRSWTRALTWVVSGIAFCSQAVASSFPQPSGRVSGSDASRWSDARATLEEPETGPSLDAELRAFVREAGSTDRLPALIRQSYAMATADQIAGLDRLWVDTLSTLADSDAMQSYMAIRSSLSSTGAESESYYLDNWLWKTTVPGDCDG